MDNAFDAFDASDTNIIADNEGDDDNAASAKEGGYKEFRSRQVKGVLYKLNPMAQDTHTKMHEYVHGGFMDKDLRFAREVFGLANTSGRKEFTTYWESPWVEEHIRDTTKRRKIESQERAMAARSFIRNSSANESDNVRKFIETVETLRKWEDNYDSRDNVKTISRLIQSFERVAVRSIISYCDKASVRSTGYKQTVGWHFDRIQRESEIKDISCIAHTLRRNDKLFDMFALLVAAEISVADAKSGTRNISVTLTAAIIKKKDDAQLALIHMLHELDDNALPEDNVGLPLMELPYNLCVSRGVLVVGPGSTQATYVLDIEGSADKDLNLDGVKTIVVSQPVFADKKRQRAYDDDEDGAVRRPRSGADFDVIPADRVF